VIAGTLLMGVAALLVFRPMRGAVKDIPSDWSSIECSINYDNVNFTAVFYTFETGQHIMLLEDQSNVEHDSLPSECADRDSYCTFARKANANNNTLHPYSYEYEMLINEYDTNMEMRFRAPKVQDQGGNSSSRYPQVGNYTGNLYEFDSKLGRLFLVRRALGLEGGFYVGQVDVVLEDAYDSNLGDWDPCGFAFGLDPVVGFLKSCVAEKNRIGVL